VAHLAILLILGNDVSETVQALLGHDPKADHRAVELVGAKAVNERIVLAEEMADTINYALICRTSAGQQAWEVSVYSP
jgi:hypothetical protein